MRHGRFCDQAMMRMERDETTKAYFDEIIDDFASIKGAESVVLISTFV